MTKRTTVVAVAVLLALASVAIGVGVATRTSSPTQPSTTTDEQKNTQHNQADVTFAQGMIPHHMQAIEMAKLAPARASNAAVKDLAVRIEAAQTPEIEQLRGYLKDFGVADMSTMGHDMETMNEMADGMADSDDLARLQSASGAEFDKLFVQLMTAHHQGAVAMAETELRDGQHVPTKNLAQAVVEAQTAEIAEMRSLEL